MIEALLELPDTHVEQLLSARSQCGMHVSDDIGGAPLVALSVSIP
jgi:hypothetical protein